MITYLTSNKGDNDMLTTILIVLAIVALLIFILGRYRR